MGDQNKLFKNYVRTRSGRSPHRCPHYEFLDSSSWKVTEYLRNSINTWAADFPVDQDFARRFKSRNDKEHLAAFFELVMFQWLKSQMLDVSFQPSSAPASNRKPDFTIGNGEAGFRAECTLAPMPDIVEGVEKMKSEIEDVIEDISSPDYFINIDFVECGQGMIAKSLIKKVVGEMLRNAKNVTMEHKFPLIDKGWRIEFSLLKKSKPTPRSLGVVFHGGFNFIDSVKPLMSSLKSKRARNYGDMDCPYVIFLNSADPYFELSDIKQALFGTTNDNFKLTADLQGYFCSNGKVQNTTVSAVVVIKGLGPYNLVDPPMSLWHNPWATFPLDHNALNIDSYFFYDNQNQYTLKTITGRKFGEVLGIDDSYRHHDLPGED